MKIFCNSLIDKNSKELEFMPGVYDNKAIIEKLIARNNNGVKFEIPEEKEEERKKNTNRSNNWNFCWLFSNYCWNSCFHC